MSISIINGPTIDGMPDGYPRSWSIRKEKNTQKRSKPVDLISNPTTYASSRTATQTEPDSNSFKSVLTPQYGTVGVNPQAHLGISQLESSLASLSDSRILGKIKNEKWSFGVFAAELPKTMKHLMTIIPRMVKVYLAFKRRLTDPKWWKSLVKRGKRFVQKRNLRGFRDASGAAAGAWLEFRYAIMPLTYDMQDALTYYHDSAIRPRIARASSGASDTYYYYQKGSVISPSYATSYSCQVRTVCYYSVSQEADALKRLGLINLPAILWELAPLSFVADMVLPIGDFIGNLDAMVGVTVVSSTRSVRSNMVDVRPGFSYYTNRYGGSTGSGQFYRRSVIPAPTNLPRFTKSPTGKQLCDIVALQRTIVFK